MEIKRLCKICGKEFTAIKTTQYFCCRKCFKKDYYMRMKMDIQDSDQNPQYPTKHCSFCNKTSELDFDPIKHPDLFNNWRCPECGVTNKLLWQYHDRPNSRATIKNLIINTVDNNEVKSVKYQVYHIPFDRPEQCKPKILTLTCEVMDILSIRKMNRKKIVFS